MYDVWGGRVDVVIFKRQGKCCPVSWEIFYDTCNKVLPVMRGKQNLVTVQLLVFGRFDNLQTFVNSDFSH
jgi:hypothetical protein